MNRLFDAYLNWMEPKLVRVFGPDKADLVVPITGILVALAVLVPIILVLCYCFL